MRAKQERSEEAEPRSRGEEAFLLFFPLGVEVEVFFFSTWGKTHSRKKNSKNPPRKQRRRQRLRVQGRRGRRRRSHRRRGGRRGPPRADRQQLDRSPQARAQARRDLQRERLLPPGDEARRRRRRRARIPRRRRSWRLRQASQDACFTGLPVLRRQAHHRALRKRGRLRDAQALARGERALGARAGRLGGRRSSAPRPGPQRPAASVRRRSG